MPQASDCYQYKTVYKPKSWQRPTDPNADADDHGHPGRAVAERLEWVHGDVAAIAAHGRQGDARGLHRHLMG